MMPDTRWNEGMIMEDQKTTKPMEVLSFLVRMMLGVMFLYAGIIKAMDPAGFALAIYNYHILPGWLVNAAAIALPSIEIMAGISLVLGLWVPGSALIISLLLFIFTTALGFNLSRGLDIACGCFSTSASGEHITWWYLLRDSSLLASALFIFFADQGFLSVACLFRGCLRRET
jgi:uncharacterized membrane protein YphA (DoxX/SURF4 family)